MSEYHYHYELPTDFSVDDLQSQLSDYTCSEHSEETLLRTYYDSFDWRIHADGGVLFAETSDKQSDLHWHSLDDPAHNCGLSLSRIPRFAWELPASPLRKHVEPVLEMRALLPQLKIRTEQHSIDILNKSGKTVTRLLMQKHRILDSGGDPAGRIDRIQAVPIKGYDKALQRVLKVLTEKLTLAALPAEYNLMTAALAQLGRKPGDYSSKPKLTLGTEQRADEAARVILLSLLYTMELNEPGTRADLDSEFLHDFRVAIRRTRSALTQIKGVFPAPELERFKAGFAWLGQITGPTRDMDVYLLKFDAYKISLPEFIQADLEPLHDFLREHQLSEQRRLVAELNRSEYSRLISDWRAFLETPPVVQPDPPNAARPIAAVARKRIWQIYRQAIREGQAITPESPAEMLHELRKTCKKLRYLMEFFQSLFPPAEIKTLIKALKVLQDNLGNFQDLEVQWHSLRQFAEQMTQESEVSSDTLLAIGMLIANLHARQHRTREEFSTRFADFTSPDHRKAFKALFRPDPDQKKAQAA